MEIQHLKALLDTYGDYQIGTPCEETWIRDAEEVLGGSFPKGFQLYLTHFGTLSFEGREFLGLTPLKGKSFEDSGYPNMVWVTQQIRAERGLPEGLVVILDENGEHYTCLDLATSDGLFCDMVVWDGSEIERFRIDFLDYLEEELEA